MRIPLEVLEGGMASVEASITAPQYRIRNYAITFIIDTGSSVNVISERDTVRFSLSIANLPFIRNVSISDVKFSLHEMKNIRLSFLTDKPAVIERINIPTFLVARSKERSPKVLEEANRVPSILGIKLILDNKFRLFLSPSEKEAYLEKIE